MANLAHAICSCCRKQYASKDRSGKPYALHPPTVLNILIQQGHGNDEHVFDLGSSSRFV